MNLRELLNNEFSKLLDNKQQDRKKLVEFEKTNLASFVRAYKSYRNNNEDLLVKYKNNCNKANNLYQKRIKEIQDVKRRQEEQRKQEEIRKLKQLREEELKREEEKRIQEVQKRQNEKHTSVKKLIILSIICLIIIGLFVGIKLLGYSNSNNEKHNCDVDNHIYGEWIVDTEATCSTSGLQHRDCKYCKEHQEEIIQALNHKNYEWITIKEPQCNKEGQKQKVCQDCRAVIETQSISAPGHKYVNGVCSVCGYKENACAKGHKSSGWIIDWDATCTSTGQKHIECTLCGQTIKTEKISLKNHTAGDWIIDKEATCTNEGQKHTECTDCGQTIKIEKISLINHIIGDWIIDKESSCEENGLKHQHCSICNQDVNSTIISATGHTYANYECTICHKKIDTTGWSTGLNIVNGVVKGIGTCTDKNIVIPSYMADGTKVTCISDNSFKYCNNLMSITIPNTVTSIGNLAFMNCTGLTSITIPNSVTSIGERCFEKCYYLTSITLSNLLTKIEYKTFYECMRLASVTIPNSITSIGDYAFYDCYQLTNVTIPSSITYIGDSSFSDSSHTKSIQFTYLGVISQWNSIKKNYFWINIGYSVSCNDGITY